MTLREINSEDIAALTQDGRLTIVGCYAPWCGPCGALMPRLEAVSIEYADVNIVKINADNNQAFMKEHVHAFFCASRSGGMPGRPWQSRRGPAYVR